MMRFAKTLLIVFAGFMANYIVFETAAIQYGINQRLALTWFAVLFIIADFLTIPLPYFLSNYIIRRLPSFQDWLNRKISPHIRNLENATGSWSETIGFAIISYFTSTWLASTIAAVMLIDFRRAFIGIIAGDLLFFATLYGSISGIEALLPGSRWKFLAVLISAIAVVTVLQKIVRWVMKKIIKEEKGPVA